MKQNLLVMFVKFPSEGKVKTRLGKDIGMHQAVELYKSFVEKLLFSLSESSVYDLLIYFSPIEKEKHFQAWLGSGVSYYPQPEGDLTVRLSHIYHKFADVYDAIGVIGSDLPTLSRDDIEKGFSFLSQFDTVIGPSTDGGYYFLAQKENQDLFSDIAWSTEVVCDQTIDKISSFGKTVTFLEPKQDIDTIADLAAYSEYEQYLKKE